MRVRPAASASIATRAALCAVLLAALAACSPKLDWREVRGTADGFVVAMPDKPQQVTRELDPPSVRAPGAPALPPRVTMSMLSTGVGPTVFAVGSVRLPAELLADPRGADMAVAWLRDALARNVRSTDPVVTPLPPERLPRGAVRRVRQGVEVRTRGTVPGPAKAGAESRAAQLAARIYVADDRLYQLVVLGAEGEVTPDAVETFFSSFRLID